MHYSTHSVSNLETIKRTVETLKLPRVVREDVLNIYRIIAEAESKAHGQPVEYVHFHEVGTKDAIMDIAAVCLIIRALDPEKIIASPICTGYGFVHCAHGIVPVPAPATANILEGMPTYQGDVEGELCTPTGAAILKYFVDEFTTQPLMKVEKTGYGFGKKTFKKLNCVRASLGESFEEESQKLSDDQVILLQCNLDDMTGEEIGYAVDKLLEKGALDVYTTSIYMKKNRPAILLSVLTTDIKKDEMVEEIFKLTTTLGVREFVCNNRYTLNRKEIEVSTKAGKIRKKISKGYKVCREKYEYDDLKSVADEKNLSIRDVIDWIRNS